MPSINVKKSVTSNTREIQRTNRQQMDIAIRNICMELSSFNNEFSKVEVAKSIMEYVTKHERLMYSGISNYIFAQSDMVNSDIVSNADTLLDYAYSNQFKAEMQRCFSVDDGEIEKCRKIILKLNDHIHLVIQQLNNLKISDTEYSERFEKEMKPVTNKLVQDMNAQLVTLVGMFTALAFIIFGGISEFNNIFSDISGISIFKLLMLGSVWGICLINLIYIFLFCIGKMTGLNFSTARKSPTASIFQKYPIVWWSNFIVISILAVNMWLYFLVYRINIMDSIYKYTTSQTIVIFIAIAGSTVMIAVIYKLAKFLKKHCNPDYDEKI